MPSTKAATESRINAIQCEVKFLIVFVESMFKRQNVIIGCIKVFIKYLYKCYILRACQIYIFVTK